MDGYLKSVNVNSLYAKHCRPTWYGDSLDKKHQILPRRNRAFTQLDLLMEMFDNILVRCYYGRLVDFQNVQMEVSEVIVSEQTALTHCKKADKFRLAK